MALFEGSRRVRSTATEEKRTRNRLVISDEIVQCADKWLTEPRLPKQFKYQFGGDSGWVVVPKGKIVSITPDRQFKEFESQKMYNAITIANGGVDVVEDNQVEIDRGSKRPSDLTYTRVANIPVGVAPFPFYQKVDDRFHGNIPNFLRRSYIEVPWIKDDAAADKCKHGHARGAGLRPNDFLKSDEHGNFVKWDPKNDCITQRVAQILRLEENMPPEGWLEWVFQHETFAIRPWLDRYGKDTNTSGFRAEDLDFNGFPYHSDFRDGFPRKRPFGNQYGPEPVEGLHDGSRIESPVVDEHVGIIPPELTEGQFLYFRVKDTPVVLVQNEQGRESVTLLVRKEGFEDVNISALIDKVDYDSGLVKVAVEIGVLSSLTEGDVYATYTATGQVPGLPPNWDELGSTGAVRLDLMF